MGTPGSGLGIHLKNAYAKKPRNREERIEMKSTFSQADSVSRTNRNKKELGRNKQLAPNNIKKQPKRSSPRRNPLKNGVSET